MPIGSNVSLKDRLIKKTTQDKNITDNTNITSKANIVGAEAPARYGTKDNATRDTKKATFYAKKELLQKLYNFAYWERYNITEAFNIALADGLKGKNTKNRGK